MGLLDFLFSKKDDVQPQAPAKPAAPAVEFDPAFITTLKDEHEALVQRFVGVKNAYLAHDFARVKEGLQEFQTALNLHLAVENAKFYAYLRRHLPPGSAELQTMNSFFDEMQEIGKVVTQFLRKYISADYTAEVQAAFGQELEGIGAALLSRISREEKTLYTLYAPRA